MKKIGPTGMRWFRSVHLLFVTMWVGGGISIVLVYFLSSPAGGDELYASWASMKIVDDFVIIPGAMGNLLMGLLYGVFTNWGFFKHRWLAVKWALAAAQILFGTFCLGPWLNGNAAIAFAERAVAPESPVFLHNQAMVAFWGVVQVAFLVVMVWISVFKPWRGRKAARGVRSSGGQGNGAAVRGGGQ